MNCQDLSSLLGFSCHPLTTDGSVALIDTPFSFDDGEELPVFVEKSGQRIRFFDDAAVVFHFLGRGLGDDQGGLRTRFIRNTIAPYGLTLTDANVIEVWASQEQSKDAFARYLGGMLALVGWERENQGVSVDHSYFVEEIALHLAAWKPGTQIKTSPVYAGMSRTEYRLDFEVAGEAILAVRPNPSSVGHALRKMVDIAGSDPDLRFRVVIEDRTDTTAAKTQGIILSSMATVMPMSKLIAASQSSASVN